MCVVSVLTLSVTAPASAQQDYPTKPIRLLVGVAPGGATDILARVVGTKLGENLRQQVIVENRPGVNHIIGGQLTAKAPPDGYTIQVIPEGFVINASMYAKLPFDPLRDFSAIAILALALPDVPTIQEAGVPGYEVAGWYGAIGPAGMPQTVVARLNREINAILTVPETRELLSTQGADPRTSTPEEFAAAMASDMKKWAKVVAAAGIKPQ